jgi:V-type H+-transporting ATPase subunit a
MGTIFRSEDMQLVQLFVQVEAAHDTLDELGKLGLIEFKDLNYNVSAFQRHFINEVKRCDEMERKLRYFEDQIEKEKENLLIEKGQDSKDTYLISFGEEEKERIKMNFDELENRFEEIEKEINEMNKNQEELNKDYYSLIEKKYVLMEDSNFFADSSYTHSTHKEEKFSVETKSLLADQQPIQDQLKPVKLGYITGVIIRQKFQSFERVLWRATRGNLFMKYSEINEKIRDPHNGNFEEKNVFIIFFQGERLYQKIKKICDSYETHLYTCPEKPEERKQELQKIEVELQDLEKVIKNTTKVRRQALLHIIHRLNDWKIRVSREKAIYHNMNKFNYDVGRKCLIAEGWCPRDSTEKIVNAMRQATESSGALVPSILSVIQTQEEPPTYYKLNKFTVSFQNIIDAYGTARYQEVNPTVFSIVTFPFLFAVMFGDFGHGFLMTLFALYLIWKEKKFSKMKLNEMFQTCFDGRYVILLMGLFSLYTGLIYNECFSVAMDLFGSAYELPKNVSDHYYVRIDNKVYPFGVDPAWIGVPNSLNYYNSLKMKLSIVLGVSQMTLGIFLSLVNGLHHHSLVDIVGEFIPQIIFFLSLFGYMVFLIFYKWLTPRADYNPYGMEPPLILNIMIGMFLSITTLDPKNKLFNGQLYVQWILIFLAFVSVPCMLLIKPFWLKYKYHNQYLRKPSSVIDEEEDEPEEPFDMGEVFVKQTIHTIEFVLGTISNTASYLRLWALSLAHSQLSAVFWEQILIGRSYSASSQGMRIIFVFIGFAIWTGATVGVLLIMESLSAFLHALRLHWVEFMNKFYHGDGKAFQPFTYESLNNNDEL